MIPVKKHLSTDVLVVGGGIAGLSAAISARASGVGVLIAEKANDLRSMQASLTEMPSIQAMNEAQTEFSKLLTQVNQVLRFIITGQVDEGGCGGSCESCGGSCSSCGDAHKD